MPKISLLLLSLFVHGPAICGSWSEQTVNSIFQTLYNEGARAAIQEVNTSNVTAYDFGMDLLDMGMHSKALSWLDAMILAEENKNKYKFGKAWVQLEGGKIHSALTTVNEIIQDQSSDRLDRARAHYMLAVFHLQVGSPYFNSEVSLAESLYEELGLNGGIILCQSLSNSQSQSKVDPDSIPIPPPRDDGDS